MMMYHLAAITIAYFIDMIIGDPPNWPHPVRWIGSLISYSENRLNNGRFKKFKGVAMLLFVVFLVFAAVFIFVFIAYKIHPFVGVAVEGATIAAAIAQKSLKEASIEVYEPLKNGDLPEARKKLSYIVGRDTHQLDEAEISRGAIETVAENTSDGVTAPLFWALIGGAPLAMVYRAVNTCDSMVGNFSDRYKEFGWASAKWDDVMNWIPSRLTGMLMLIGNRPKRMNYQKAWMVLFRDAKKHPSPNSGWGEAAVASILGIQLGGTNYYKGIVSNRAKMGDPIHPIQADHIIQANTILTRTVFLFLVFLWIGGTVFERAVT
ncbi:adenosylcobinamide-phosphate synthase CbiB [Neobacillus kokaensis]|uniref:Cobalamin biosynthesis protein CobD n=1 Tax=Neobacillus kokaensis TaxID=2759023 RepID=A0ABQ3MYB5_9BACI|nr:adenosylcobinamide-phosphate synthase CbiB [Neobacillus kokaensis]GHH96829.1 cobalamin biosynthesis protein [Neobacillus kokaensis]